MTHESGRTGQQLKQFLRRKVYFSEDLKADRQRSIEMIGGLFQYFMADVNRLPAGYAEQASERAPHLVVCDYIAGMTDGYCARVYAGLLSR
jgi:dGTPase